MTDLVTKSIEEAKTRDDASSLAERAEKMGVAGLLVCASKVGIILADRQQMITHVNDAFTTITGYAASESIGKRCSFLQGSKTDRAVVRTIREALAKDQPVRVAILNYRKDGCVFWNALTVAPLRDSKGLVTGYVGVQLASPCDYVQRPLELLPWVNHLPDTRKITEISKALPADTDPVLNPYLPAPRKPSGLKVETKLSINNELKEKQEAEKREESRKVAPTANANTTQQNGTTLPTLKAVSPSASIDEPLSSVAHAAHNDNSSGDNSSSDSDDDEECDCGAPEHKKPTNGNLQQGRNGTSTNTSTSTTTNGNHTSLNGKSSPEGKKSATVPFDPTLVAPSKCKKYQKSTTVSFVAETLLPTDLGKYRVRAYRDSSKPAGMADIICMIWGQIESKEDVIMRVHDACFTSEVLGSLKCDCREQLEFAKHYIQHGPEKQGMIIYLPQEGRGIGLANKIKAYSLQELGYDTVDANRVLGFKDDYREYSVVPTILDMLQVKSVRLMTNNPRKINRLRKLGINISGRIPVVMDSNEFSENYIKIKRSRMGHMIS